MKSPVTSPVILPVNKDIQEPPELVAAIRARRGGSLLKLDRMLLHSPPLAQGWNVYLGKIREELLVPAQLRELAMCVVAILNKADYEYEHHAPLYIKNGGTPAKAEELRCVGQPLFNKSLYTELEQAVIALAHEMTLQIRVSEGLKRLLVTLLGTQQTVELVGVVATYNMVSRFLVALDITEEDHSK
jgi:alkylhydroperoxidase family enzyme